MTMMTLFRCFHSGSLRQPLKAQVEGILIKRVSLNKCQTFLGLLAISRVAQLNILKQTFFFQISLSWRPRMLMHRASAATSYRTNRQL